ncbi:Inositol-pentakisphosphate 2-kinase, partial [Stegodyphus mimosarum]
MLPDYCSLPPHLKNYPSFGPVISVEIKPKQGFMLQDEFLLPGQSFVPMRMCRFCMMQQYKVKQGVISEKSGYCPTDLYSGCPIRMRHSLKMLLKTPQNNFRIFKDQKLIYSEEKKSNLNDVLSDFFDVNDKLSYSDLLCTLIIQVLLRPLEAVNLPISSAKKVSQMCINAYSGCSKFDPCHFLPVGCVLDKILRVQTLASFCISDVYSLYLKIKSCNTHQRFDNIG